MFTVFRRAIAAISLVALVATLSAAPANAAEGVTGVGSTTGGISLLTVDYGDLLDATVLGESNSTTIDPTVGVPTATQVLSPLLLNVAGLDASLPSVQTTSTGAEDQKTTDLVDLSALGVPGLTGEINPATLKSLVDASGAKSSLTSTLANLNAAGILAVDSAALELGGLAGPTASNANRALTADAITVLDLQALLNFLGLDISDLSLAAIVGLLEDLGQLDALNGLLGENFADSAAVLAEVDSLDAAIDSAQTTLTAALDAVASQQSLINLCGGVQACIDLLTPTLVTLQSAATAAQTAVDTLQALLDELLQGVIDLVTGTPLIAIDGVSAGALANAVDTVAGSTATVTGTINDIRIAGLDIGSIDANTTLDQIEALAATATQTLNDILATIDPSLANLISIQLLDRTTEISQVGDYVNAAAGITALAVTLTPPDLCDIFTGFGLELPEGVNVDLPTAPVTDLLTEIGSGVLCEVPIPAGVVDIGDLAIGEGEFAALTGPITLKAASVGSLAQFKATPATTTQTPTEDPLPRTGMNETLLLVVGGLMAAVAVGLRRTAAPVKVRANRK